jgi:hypothetical protein
MRLFSLYQRCTQCASYQTFRREINGHKSISHPNVLPIIEVSETSVSILYHEPVDAKWEHHTVHPDEPGCLIG